MIHSLFSVISDIWDTIFELFTYVIMGAEA